MILSTACTNMGKKAPMKVETKDRAPKSLVSILEGLDKVLESVDRIEEISRLTSLEYESLHGKGEKKDEKTKGDQDKDKEETTGIENQVSNKDIELLKKWDNLETLTDKIHKDWNNYEIESRKKGASSDKGRDLKNNLDNITKGVENRDTKGTIEATSKSLYSLAYFFNLYKDDINGYLCKIKYAVLQAYLHPENGKEILDKREEDILILKQRLEKDKTKLKNLDKLYLSIKDMENSLEGNSRKLLKTKKDIVFKNIESLKE